MLARGGVLPRTQSCFAFCHSTCIYRRAFSTTELSNGIKLAYDLHEPPTTSSSSSSSSSSKNNAPPIIFIHGLFGSKKNNRSMSKYAPCTTPCQQARRPL